jgi:hypothetical protein
MDRQTLLGKNFHRLTATLVLMSVVATTLTAQMRQKAPAAQPAKAAAQKAGWSGVVNYRKTLADDFSSDEKLFGRISEQERIKHNQTRRYSYEGNIVVNDLAGTGRPATTAKVNFIDSEYHKVVQTELTECHSWEQSRLIKAESVDRKTTTGTGSGEAYSFSLSVYADTMRLGFTMPEINGKYTSESSSTYSNLCPNSTRTPSASTNTSDARIPGGGASIEALIDPKNPDVLEGSKTWTDGATSTSKGWTYTVTWRFRRTPQPLIITDVRFEQPIYPSPNDWREIGEKGHTVDGNQVKIIATIANLGATEKSATVKFRELKENTDLPNAPLSATIPANGQKEVELIWDTSGYAWRQSGTDVVPEMNRQIEVSIPDDTMQKELKVIPKPVIVAWGIWQWFDAYKKFRDYFTAVNDKWNVWTARNDARTLSTDNADILDSDIRQIQKGENAWHVDMVALRNGGLVGRVYVNSKMPTQFDGRPTVPQMIMISVPNLGTPCATGLYGLSFKLNTLNLDAVGELSPESMKRFNLLVNNTNGTKFAAIAVDSRKDTCQEDDVHGDGFVPVTSAIWRVKRKYVTTANVGSMDVLSDVSVFREVYKWLAVPPKGDHNPDPGTLAQIYSDEDLLDPRESLFGKFRNVGAAFAGFSQPDDTDPRPDFANVVRIDARESVEIEIPVKAGSRFALNLYASPEVSATLVNEQGEILGKNLTGTPESNDIFRTISVRKPFAAGKWKLILENRLTTETEAAITAFIDYTPTN